VARLSNAASNAIVMAVRAGIGATLEVVEVILVLAVLLLLPVTGSVTPAGGVTVATFAIAPLTPDVPFTVSVTLPPAGSVGIGKPACNCATVGDVGHIAPPLCDPQLTVVATKFATAASVTTAPFAAAGPWLVTTSV